MEDFVTLRLPRNDVGQIVEGLTERMIIWKNTEQYLETGFTELGDCIEECSHSYEAHFIWQYYEKIIDLIKTQIKEQR